MTHNELLDKIYWHWRKDNRGDGLQPMIDYRTALLAVVELHKPSTDGLGCSYEFIECHDHTGLGCDVPPTCNQYQSYPCPTIQAIEGQLK